MPAFVVLGGLVPALLCGNSAWRHAGTTDIDVQADLEIAAGSVDAPRLEQALMAAGFTLGKQGDTSKNGVWRWQTSSEQGNKVEVQFDLLADHEELPADHPSRSSFTNQPTGNVYAHSDTTTSKGFGSSATAIGCVATTHRK